MTSLIVSRAGTLVAALAIAFGVQCNVAITSCHAADPSVIGQIERDTIAHICSKDEWLQTCFHKSGSCEELVKPIVEKCLKEVLLFAPGQLELQTALVYSVNAMTCFNRESSEAWGPKPKTAACEEAARHLE